MTIQIRETGALRFPALAMRGNAASAVEFDALEAEIIAAREGEASLDAKLDLMDAATAAVTSEVTTARSGSASLDARIDAVAATAGAAATDAEFTALQAEVTTARSGKASLDARIDDVVKDSINAAPEDAAITDDSRLTYTDNADSYLLKHIEWQSLRAIAYERLGAHIAGTAAKATPLVGGDDFVIADSEAANATKRVSFSELLTDVRTALGPNIIAGSTAKTTLSGSDDFAISDSSDVVTPNSTKRVSFAAVLTDVRTAFGPNIIEGATVKATLAAGDDFIISDSAAANVTKRVAWSALKADVLADTTLDARLDDLVKDSINTAPNDPAITTTSRLAYTDGGDSFLLKYFTWTALLDSIRAALGPTIIAGATAKTDLIGADVFAIADNADVATNATKKLSWTSLQGSIRSVFGPSIITGAIAKTTLADGDDFAIADSEDGVTPNATKKVSWAILKADLGAAAAGDLDALEAEVIAARSGKASLDARIDDVVKDTINAVPNDPAITTTSRLTYTDGGDSFLLKYITWTGVLDALRTALGPTIIAGATVKTSLIGADAFAIADNADVTTNATKKLSWTALQDSIRTAFGPTIIQGATAKATIAAGDDFIISDSAATNATKYVPWSVLKADVLAGTMNDAGVVDGIQDALGPTIIAGADPKTDTLIGADAFVIADNADAVPNTTKRLTWTSLKDSIRHDLGPSIIAGTDAKTTLTGGDDFAISDSEDATQTNATKRLSWTNLRNNIRTAMGPTIIAGATSKTTALSGADAFAIADNADPVPNTTKRLTWTSLQNDIRTVLGPSIIAGATAKTTLLDGDDFAIAESGTNTTKRISFADMLPAFHEGLGLDDISERIDASLGVHDSGLDARPGDRPDLFTETLLGAFPDIAPLSGILTAFDTDGEVLRVSGARKIASRVTFRIEPGRNYKVRGVVRRRINAADPSNDAVALKIQWLDMSQTTSKGTTVVVNENDLITASGRFTMTGIVALTAGDGIDFVAPVGSLYGRVYVETFGLATTDVEIVEATDITEASIVDTGDAALEARVAAIESEDLPARVEVLEAAGDGSEVARYKSRAGAVAAAASGGVPTSVDIVEVLSGATDTDGLQRRYARSVASSGTDWFPDLDGSFWVWAPEKIVASLGYAARSKEERAGEMPCVEDWRGHGGDSTDTGCLQAAIAAAKAAGGMRLRVPGRHYTIDDTLLIDGSHIWLIGDGSGYYRGSASTVQTSARSSIRWAGAPGGTIMRFTTPAGLERCMGGGLAHLQLDGMDFLAARGLVLESWVQGEFRDVQVHACSESQFRLAIVNTAIAGSQPADTQHNYFEHCRALAFGGSGDYLVSLAYGYHLTGGSSLHTGNSCFNTFVECTAYMAKGISWKLENTDTNYFFGISGSASRDAAQYGLELGSTDQDSTPSSALPGSCRHNIFTNCAVRTIARSSQTGGDSSHSNAFFGTQRGNGQPRPVIETAAGGATIANLSYWDSDGNVAAKTLGMTEVTASPTTTPGLSQLYVDAVAGPVKLKDSAGAVRELLDTTWLTTHVGAWTPAFSFVTPGDSVITHTTQVGKYLKLGNFVLIMVDIQFSTNAYTTASGSAQITGLPYFCSAVVDGSLSLGAMYNVTFDETKILTPTIPQSSQVIWFKVATSNATVTHAGITAFPPSKTNIVIRGTGMYWTNTLG